MLIEECFDVGIKMTGSTTENRKTVLPLFVVSEVCGFKATGTTYRKRCSFVFLSETPATVKSQKAGASRKSTL